ncbi:hypothetical protein HO133_002101 [Letharia lupina]|uniref:Rhodopsin domain-containing protein n=1 Tax=Letharia lupina TaxID=560253 RepID=A0A8H6CDM8_9LECA|nr:uncharacterized protein HO133_002101 [Letharia lupina]KAF6221246.1 hypothetical protein HO133_002101 [Letharia lupina]
MGNENASTVQILTWFLIITSILGVGARGLTKAILVRSVSLDDYLITVALLFAIGQSVAVSVEAGHGYGSPSDPLSRSQATSNLKSEYAASLLYVASLGFAKASVVALVNTLTPIRSHRRATYGLAIFLFLWVIIGEFGTAFLCHLPRPWDYLEGHCSNDTIRRTWWNYFESTNIITDLALICLPIVVIWQIRISLSRKASVCSFFALRSTVIAASACKLVFWNNTQDLQKPGHNPWTVTLCTQIIQCLSIVSACFLYLKPFLDSVESGFIRSDDIRRRGTNEYHRHHTTTTTTTGGSSTTRSAFSTRKHARTGSQSFGLVGVPNPRHITTVTANDPPDFDAQSQHSRTHIIKETRTFAVEGSANEL